MKKAIIIMTVLSLSGCEATTLAESLKEDHLDSGETAVLEPAAAPEHETPKYEYYDAYAQLEGEVYTSEMTYDYIQFADKDYIYDYAEDIVVGHVISIDKGSNWNEIAEEYCTPYTLGRFVVLKSFKGDLREGSVYQYGRQGGIVTAQEYYATYEDKGDKFKRMTGTDPDYIGQFPIHSNKIEVGKTYLMYIVSAQGVKDTCAIFGQKCGLRELDELFPEDYANAKVFNNVMEEWENLADVVPEV